MFKPKALSPWLKQLGDNIRRERIAKDLSQQQLAELAELNIRNVQRIEAGEIDVLLRTTVRIIIKGLGSGLYGARFRFSCGIFMRWNSPDGIFSAGYGAQATGHLISPRA